MAATLNSIWTILALVIFIGIVVWAWSSRRKADFDEASRLPLDDDQPLGGASENPSEDKKNV